MNIVFLKKAIGKTHPANLIEMNSTVRSSPKYSFGQRTALPGQSRSYGSGPGPAAYAPPSRGPRTPAFSLGSRHRIPTSSG
jgi:hypothetical protein